MSLTFERKSRLAYYYGNIFRSMGDVKTANIMDIIYEDELNHVRLGAFWLKQHSPSKSLWDSYLECLPEGIIPPVQGISFNSHID